MLCTSRFLYNFISFKNSFVTLLNVLQRSFTIYCLAQKSNDGKPLNGSLLLQYKATSCKNDFFVNNYVD